MPKVSVIIATYNRENFIVDCLESVLNQTFTDFEVIVVDDGSIDGTDKALASFGDRIRCKKIAHSGPSVPRNVAIEMAQGELIAFNDDDDLWLPNNLELHVALMDLHPELGLVFADLGLFDESGVICDSWMNERMVFKTIPRTMAEKPFVIFPDSIFKYLVKERFMTMPTLMVRRQCLDQVGHFDPTLEAQVDYDLFLRLAKEFQVGYIDTPVARCRIHSTNLSGNPERRIRSKTVLWGKILNLYPDLPADSRRLVAAQQAYWYYELGYYYFSRNRFGPARRNLLKSLAGKPLYRAAWVYLMATMLPTSIIDMCRRWRRNGAKNKPGGPTGLEW